MNPTEACTLVMNAIDEREPTEKISLHLCHFEGKLQCLPARHGHVNHRVFLCFTQPTLQKGFTSKTWETLFDEVARFYSQIEKGSENEQNTRNPDNNRNSSTP